MADDPPFHNPFSVLSSLKGSLPDKTVPAAPVKPALAPAATAKKPIARAVVRLQRTGRGGKEVTVVEQLPLAASDREIWLKALKSALGCGGVVEGESLVLQGDQRKRLPALLTARGVKKVTIG
jgi:translation initiation factor 1